MQEKINSIEYSTLFIEKKLQQCIKVHCAKNNIKIKDYVANLIRKDLNLDEHNLQYVSDKEQKEIEELLKNKDCLKFVHQETYKI